MFAFFTCHTAARRWMLPVAVLLVMLAVLPCGSAFAQCSQTVPEECDPTYKILSVTPPQHGKIRVKPRYCECSAWSNCTGVDCGSGFGGACWEVDSNDPYTTHLYPPGADLDIEAISDTGYVFSAWQGATGGSTTTLTMNTSKSIGATFVQAVPVRLTYVLSDPSVGSLSFSPGPMNSGPGWAEFPIGSTVQITAVAQGGHSFVKWAGALSGSTNPQSLLLNEQKAITAYFSSPLAQLQVNVLDSISLATLSTTAQDANGHPVHKASSVVSGNTLTEEYPQGANVTVTLNPGYHKWNGWTGAITGMSLTPTVTVTGTTVATANIQEAVVVALVSPNGMIATNPQPFATTVLSESVKWLYFVKNPQATLQLTPSPNAGYAFYQWESGLEGTVVPGVVLLGTGHYIEAEFRTTHTVNVTTVGNGTVTVSPAPRPDGTYFYDTAVTLTATPAEGHGLYAWSGSATGSQNPKGVYIDGNKSIQADFRAWHDFSLDVTGEGTVKVTGASDYLAFGDGFTDGTLAPWVNEQAGWTVTSGEATNNAGSVWGKCYLPHPNMDYECTFKYRRTVNGTDARLLVHIRQKDTSNYVRLALMETYLALDRQVNGVYQYMIGNHAEPTELDVDYYVRCVCDGPSITVYRGTSPETMTQVLQYNEDQITSNTRLTFSAPPGGAKFYVDDVNLATRQPQLEAPLNLTAAPFGSSNVTWEGDLTGTSTAASVLVGGPKAIRAIMGSPSTVTGTVQGEGILSDIYGNVIGASCSFDNEADGQWQLTNMSTQNGALAPVVSTQTASASIQTKANQAGLSFSYILESASSQFSVDLRNAGDHRKLVLVVTASEIRLERQESTGTTVVSSASEESALQTKYFIDVDALENGVAVLWGTDPAALPGLLLASDNAHAYATSRFCFNIPANAVACLDDIQYSASHPVTSFRSLPLCVAPAEGWGVYEWTDTTSTPVRIDQSATSTAFPYVVNLTPTTNTAINVELGRILTFPDANLAQLVADSVGTSPNPPADPMPYTDDILPQHVQSLTTLDYNLPAYDVITGVPLNEDGLLPNPVDQIRDLTGISQLPSLEFLRLKFHDIQDINAPELFAGLSNLHTVQLIGNPAITGVAALAHPDLTALSSLQFSSCPLVDVTAIQGKQSVTFLALYYANVNATNLNTIALLPNLTGVNIGGNGLIEGQLSCLTNLQHLRTVSSANNQLDGVQPLVDNPYYVSDATTATLGLVGNPLSGDQICDQIAQLTTRGVNVTHDTSLTCRSLSVVCKDSNAQPYSADIILKVFDGTTWQPSTVTSVRSGQRIQLSVSDPEVVVYEWAKESGQTLSPNKILEIDVVENLQLIAYVDEEVIFADLALENAIRAAISRPVGALVKHQVEGITSLFAASSGITNLSGMEHLVNLEILSLIGNSITDLSPLSTLTGITQISLGSNLFTDLSPLATLVNLQSLGLNNNAVTDLSPLQTLQSLQQVYLRYNEVIDVSPLATLPALEAAYLSDNNILSLQPLADSSSFAGSSGLHVILDVVNNPLSDPLTCGHLEQLADQYVDVLHNADLGCTSVVIETVDTAGAHVSGSQVNLEFYQSGSTWIAAPFHSFRGGSILSATAIAPTGWRFSHWEGDLDGTSATTSFALNADRLIRAVFVEDYVTLLLDTSTTDGRGVCLIFGDYVSSTSGPGFIEYTFERGQSVAVTFAGMAGWTTDLWETRIGGSHGIPNFQTATSLSVQLDQDTYVRALPGRSLVANIFGNGSVDIGDTGEVLSSASAEIRLPTSTVYTLHANPASGYEFDHWIDPTGVMVTADALPVTMTEDRRITAVFSPEDTFDPALLNVSVGVSGSGAVWLDPPQTAATQDTIFTYVPNTTVSVEAMASPGWEFAGWSGDIDVQTTTGSLTTTASLTVDAAKAFSAHFVPEGTAEPLPPYEASVEIVGNGYVLPAGGRYYEDELAVFVAKPAFGWRFDHWEGDATGDVNVMGIVMTGNVSLCAVFTPGLSLVPEITQPERGAVFVGASDDLVPNEPDLWNAGFLLDGTESVTVTAVASDGHIFDHWEGDLSGTDTEMTVQMTSHKFIRPVFLPVYPLDLIPLGEGTITAAVTGRQFGTGNNTDCVEGSYATLTATPAEGWKFVGWEGDLPSGSTLKSAGGSSSIESTVTVPMTNAAAVRALFRGSTFSLGVSTSPSRAGGSVTVSPEKEEYAYGEQVELVAEAGVDGWVFDYWEDINGEVVSHEDVLLVTETGNQRLRAHFKGALQCNVFIPPHIIVENQSGGNDLTPGQYVTLDATPEEEYLFEKWIGSLRSTDSSVGFMVTRNMNIAAVAGEGELFHLAAKTDSIDMCTVSMTPEGEGSYNIFYDGTDQEVGGNYRQHQVVELRAAGAAVRWRRVILRHDDPTILGNWVTEGVTSRSNTVNIRAVPSWVGSRVLYVADPVINPIAPDGICSIKCTPNGRGIVTEVYSDELFEGQTCFYYARDEDPFSVNLCAIPDDGYQLAHWDCSPSATSVHENHLHLSLDPDVQYTVGAFFEPIYPMLVDVQIEGGGTVGPEWEMGQRNLGEHVYLAATPNVGYVFDHWQDVSTGLPGTPAGTSVFLDFIANTNKRFKAVFKPLHKLTIDCEAGGVIERSPNAVRYPEGDTVTLTPLPNPGWRFHHWEGDLTGDEFSPTITMDAERTVIPVFVPNITMHVDINDDGNWYNDTEAKENGDPEYMLVEDMQDNGAGLGSFQTNVHIIYPAGGVIVNPGRSDNLQKVILSGAHSALWGSLEFRFSGGADALTVLGSTSINSQVPMPYTTDAGTPFPDAFYLWAPPGSVDQETNVLVELVYRDSNGFEGVVDEFNLAITPGLGAPSYFASARDYMSENDTKLFTDAKTYGAFFSETFKVVVMPEERTLMVPIEGYHRADRLRRIADVVQAYPEKDVVINGNFAWDMDPEEKMCRRCRGVLVQHYQVHEASQFNSTSPSGVLGYVARSGIDPITYVFSHGEVPCDLQQISSTYSYAIGGLVDATQPGSAINERQDIVVIGKGPDGGTGGVIFIALTVPILNVAPGGALDRSANALLKEDVFRSNAQSLFHLDGASSVALALRKGPTGSLSTCVMGWKHWPINVRYRINNYLTFNVR